MIEYILDFIWKSVVNYRIKKFEESQIYSVKQFISKFGNGEKAISPPNYFRIETKSVVISVGNVSMGGSGKTPLVKKLLNDFIPLNYSTCVISKGYKRKSKEDRIITHENFTEYTCDEIGDEAALILYNCKKPVSVASTKYKALIKAEIELNPDVVVIDDGFQHRWIKKDIEILIVDSETINNPHFPPFGRLREPVENLLLADFILMPQYADISEFPFLNNNNKVLYFEINEGTPYSIINSQSKFDWEKKNLVISGIAKPARFYKSLEKLSIPIKKKIAFADHYNYTLNSINGIIKTAVRNQLNIITTEKDAIKLIKYKNEFKKYNIEVFALPIELNIIDENNLLKERILKEIIKKNL